MNTKRLWQTICLNFRRGAARRGRYLKQKKICAFVGENVRFQPRLIPLYPELIRLHDNIMVGAGVRFVTHDATHTVLNRLGEGKFPEQVGGIEVMDNVFIGFNAIILGNVRIGENCIIGAGTLVNRDLEAGGIYGGVPAKRIGEFSDFVAKRKAGQYPTVLHNQHISQEEIQKAWEDFDRQRRNQK